MQWDLFCRVIDNWGDVGFCSRLASDLRSRGQRVRLWVDDPSALGWMAPESVGVHLWQQLMEWPEPGDVVIEAFGCETPPAFVARMVALARPPVWINLEYLSAEASSLRNHGLRSPHLTGLDKYFYYPGWLPGSGGLLRESNLELRRAQFDAQDWLASRELTPRRGERLVSLFCYPNPAMPQLLQVMQQHPTSLLVTAGHASHQVRSVLGNRTQINGLRVNFIPELDQIDFDHLLWACDVNFVRGEDSFVRAQWAKRPFIWHIYPQADRVHEAKLRAFHRLMEGFSCLSPQHLSMSLAWNGLACDQGGFPWPNNDLIWQKLQYDAASWCNLMQKQTDLTTGIMNFVTSHRPAFF